MYFSGDLGLGGNLVCVCVCVCVCVYGTCTCEVH